jgi:2-deoxy-D-gluconate 3-dehydrogenase
MSTAPPLIATLFSLEGQTAIVTGGTGGLGHAMTMALAEGGADIVSIEMPSDPNSKTTAEGVSKAGRKLTRYECDVGDSKALRATFSKIWEDGHQADILLNCAGIQRRSPAELFDDDTIDEVFNVNLKATFVACQEFAKQNLPKTQDGTRRAKIINVGSIISFIGGNHIGAYAATKGGVLQTTKAFSSEWAGKGINVNVICPGYFRTEMTKQYSEDPQ